MNTKDYLDKVAYIGPPPKDLLNIDGDVPDCYYSKFDDSYIIQVGMEDNVKFLADREITERLTHGVGFSFKDRKWYGWSHRAIFGFKIGSTCKKGDCHYTANTPEDLIEDRANFFADISEECAEQHRAECQILSDRSGIRILHTPIKLPMATLDNVAEALSDIDSLPEVTLFENDFTEVKCGKGEWIAKTMADAKQMAQDFNEGVS